MAVRHFPLQRCGCAACSVIESLERWLVMYFVKAPTIWNGINRSTCGVRPRSPRLASAVHSCRRVVGVWRQSGQRSRWVSSTLRSGNRVAAALTMSGTTCSGVGRPPRARVGTGSPSPCPASREKTLKPPHSSRVGFTVPADNLVVAYISTSSCANHRSRLRHVRDELGCQGTSARPGWGPRR